MNEGASPTLPTTSTRSKLRRGYRFALIGLVFGFSGLGTAVYRMTAETPPPPPHQKEDAGAITIRIKLSLNRMRGRSTPAPAPPATPAPQPAISKLGLAASIFGFIGAVFGCVSWVAGEHRRWTWAALSVGVLALAWTQVVAGISMAIAIVVLLLILSSLG